jgi:hypothetical protein
MRKDNLKILLKKVELEQPSSDFTSEIMQELAGQHDRVLTPALRSVLQRNSENILPANFTDRVMAEVHREKIVIKPIISRKAWIVISFCLMAIFTLLLSMDNGNVLPGGATSHFVSLGTALRTLLSNASTLWLITFFSISALLMMDYLLHRVRKTDIRKTSSSI